MAVITAVPNSPPNVIVPSLFTEATPSLSDANVTAAVVALVNVGAVNSVPCSTETSSSLNLSSAFFFATPPASVTTAFL